MFSQKYYSTKSIPIYTIYTESNHQNFANFFTPTKPWIIDTILIAYEIGKTYLGDTPTDDQRANKRMCLYLSPLTFISQYNYNKKINKKGRKWLHFLTSGKLYRIPHTTYNLELIWGSVADIGDLTKPVYPKNNI